MGVLDRSKWFGRGGDEETYPYKCMACDEPLPVQYHSCPECDCYDIRATKWVEE